MNGQSITKIRAYINKFKAKRVAEDDFSVCLLNSKSFYHGLIMAIYRSPRGDCLWIWSSDFFLVVTRLFMLFSKLPVLLISHLGYHFFIAYNTSIFSSPFVTSVKFLALVWIPSPTNDDYIWISKIRQRHHVWWSAPNLLKFSWYLQMIFYFSLRVPLIRSLESPCRISLVFSSTVDVFDLLLSLLDQSISCDLDILLSLLTVHACIGKLYLDQNLYFKNSYFDFYLLKQLIKN